MPRGPRPRIRAAQISPLTKLLKETRDDDPDYNEGLEADQRRCHVATGAPAGDRESGRGLHGCPVSRLRGCADDLAIPHLRELHQGQPPGQRAFDHRVGGGRIRPGPCQPRRKNHAELVAPEGMVARQRPRPGGAWDRRGATADRSGEERSYSPLCSIVRRRKRV